MKQLIRIMTDDCQADATVTYFLISVVEKIFSISITVARAPYLISLGNTSRFIPIQWHSKLSILDTEQQIYSTFFHRSGFAKGTTHYSGQSKVIRLKYIPWLTSQNFQSFKQFNTYLYKRYGHFCTSSSKT